MLKIVNNIFGGVYMKIIRYINGQKTEKKDFPETKIVNEIVSNTISSVNKRNYFVNKGMTASDE